MKKRIIALVAALLMCLTGLTALTAEDCYGFTNAETKLYMGASEKAVLSEVLESDVRLKIIGQTMSEDMLWYSVEVVKTKAAGFCKAANVDLMSGGTPADLDAQAV